MNIVLRSMFGNRPICLCPQSSQNNVVIRCQSFVESFIPTLDHQSLACLEAASQLKSVAWINALPSSFIGTLLDYYSLRIGVAILLGLRVSVRVTPAVAVLQLTNLVFILCLAVLAPGAYPVMRY